MSDITELQIRNYPIDVKFVAKVITATKFQLETDAKEIRLAQNLAITKTSTISCQSL